MGWSRAGSAEVLRHRSGPALLEGQRPKSEQHREKGNPVTYMSISKYHLKRSVSEVRET
jgi:hypothetical protein